MARIHVELCIETTEEAIEFLSQAERWLPGELVTWSYHNGLCVAGENDRDDDQEVTR